MNIDVLKQYMNFVESPRKIIFYESSNNKFKKWINSVFFRKFTIRFDSHFDNNKRVYVDFLGGVRILISIDSMYNNVEIGYSGISIVGDKLTFHPKSSLIRYKVARGNDKQVLLEYVTNIFNDYSMEII